MRNKQLKLSAVLLLGFGLMGLQAQTSVNVSGSDARGSGGSAGYSVGQLVYQTHTAANGSAVQGIQQPYEISVLSAIEDAKGINLSATAYPNPVTGLLTLSIDAFEFLHVSYRLYDMSGKILQHKKIISSQTKLDMSKLAPATYFVKIFLRNNEVKTFKIIKN